MIKSFVRLLISLFILSSLFLCCSKNNEINVSVETQYKIYSFARDFTFNSLNNVNNKKVFYIPDSIKRELNRTVIRNSIFYSVDELYFPDKIVINNYSDFYDCNSDNGLWVDDLLNTIEEERLGEELKKMENVRNSLRYVATESVAASEIEKQINGLSSKEVKNQDGTLAFMEFDNEIFIPEKRGNEWILTSASNNKVTRRFYDNLFRCHTEESWNITSNGNEELKKAVSTKFYDDTFLPSLKTVVKGDNVQKKKYNKKGFVESEDNFKTVDKKEYIQSSMHMKYNEKDQVIESSETEYTYDDEDCHKLLYSFDKKYLYTYSNNKSDDITPDFDYYENGVLRMRNKYTSSDTYKSQIFFDNKYSVTTFYEDGKLVKEIFNIGDGTERIKSYE